MKKAIVFLSFLFFAQISFSQSGIYPYDLIKLDKPSDYKDAEPLALSAATYLLSYPFKEKDIDRTRAMVFLSKWMAGNTDYHFQVQGIFMEVTEERELFNLFVAAMCKFSLENKTVSGSASIVEKSTVKIVLEYCNNPSNNFTLKKKWRKKLESN